MLPRRALITFDVRGTLIRVTGSPGQQYAAAGEKHGIRADPIALNSAFGAAYRAVSVAYPNFGHLQPGHPALSAADWWKGVVRETFVGAGVDAATVDAVLPSLSGALYSSFAQPTAWQVYPEVSEVLPSLAQENVLGVISNFDERLEQILSGLRIRRHFSFVLASGVFGTPKPDRRIFHEAIRIASVRPNGAPTRLLHVGDDAVTDFEGARAAGMEALLLKRDAGPDEALAPHVIRDLRGIATYLGRPS